MWRDVEQTFWCSKQRLDSEQHVSLVVGTEFLLMTSHLAQHGTWRKTVSSNKQQHIFAEHRNGWGAKPQMTQQRTKTPP